MSSTDRIVIVTDPMEVIPGVTMAELESAVDRAALCLRACEGVDDATLERLRLPRTLARLCELERACEKVVEADDEYAADFCGEQYPYTVLDLIDDLREALDRTRL